MKFITLNALIILINWSIVLIPNCYLRLLYKLNKLNFHLLTIVCGIRTKHSFKHTCCFELKMYLIVKLKSANLNLHRILVHFIRVTRTSLFYKQLLYYCNHCTKVIFVVTALNIRDILPRAA